MKIESSLTCSQETVTCPYPEPDQYCPGPETISWKIHLIILPPSKWPLYFGFPHQIPVCFTQPFRTCYMPSQSTSSSFIRTILGDCRTRSYSCYVLQSHASSGYDFGVHFLHLLWLLFILKTFSSTRNPVVWFTPSESDSFTLELF